MADGDVPGDDGASDASDEETATVGRDRRAAARHDLITFCWWSLLPDIEPSSPKAVNGLAQVRDISRTGVGLVIAQRIPAGALVYTKIVSDHASITTVGRVVHCREVGPSSYTCGVHFEVMSPVDRLALRKLTAE